jgi:hypothetical protein
MATRKRSNVTLKHTKKDSSRKRAAAAGKGRMVQSGKRGLSKRSVDYDRDLHGDPQGQATNTRSIEFRTVPPTGIAKERHGKK